LPGKGVTKGIVNALIHRNYLEVGSEVHIEMYDDRLEVYSPGGMYDAAYAESPVYLASQDDFDKF